MRLVLLVVTLVALAIPPASARTKPQLKSGTVHQSRWTSAAPAPAPSTVSRRIGGVIKRVAPVLR